MNDFSNEVKSRWGNTAAYKEHNEKTKNYTKEKWEKANNGLTSIFEEFSALKVKGESADSVSSIELVKKLQNHISAHYYTCTNEILAGLGKMYVADDRFKKNIDKSGEGMAEFVSSAIEAYLK